MPDERLRGVGLSGQKTAYLRDLCRRIEDGQLPLDVLGSNWTTKQWSRR